jgi:hypothetical protein
MIRTILSTALFVASVTAVQAQEWVFSVGYADFSNSASIDKVVFSAEYHLAPFYTRGPFDLGFAGVLDVNMGGDIFTGAGLAGVYELNDRWYLEGSVMPGAFHESISLNDLGGTFQIRSLMGVGYTLDSGSSLSLALVHTSNASTASKNPGLNVAMVRLRHQF